MNIDLRGTLRAAAALTLALLVAHCGDEPASGTPTDTNQLPAANGGGSIAGTVPTSASVSTPGRGVAGRGTAGTASSAGGSGALAPAGAGGASAVSASGTSGSSASQGSVAGSSGTIAGASGSTGGAAGSVAGGQTWPTGDVGADGPFMSMTVSNTGPSNGYMLFFPVDLGRDGLKHPLITWGNGAGSTPGGYKILPRLATHGFVVIASNSSSVTGALMNSGIDWLIMENDREGSMFKGKIDPTKAAAMGYSLGSLGSFEAAADARIKTTVHISGGSMDHSVVANLKNPAAFYCGNDSDIAYDNCEIDFQMAKVPLIYANFPGGHGGVIGAQSAQISKAAVGWMRWRLMGDKTLDAMFVGPDCTLCKDSAWDKVQQKDLAVAPP